MIDSKVTKVTNSIFMAEYQRKQIIVIALSKRSVACLYLPELFFPFGGVEHLLLLTDKYFCSKSYLAFHNKRIRRQTEDSESIIHMMRDVLITIARL